MQTSTLSYWVGDLECRSFLAVPDERRVRPAVLVGPEGPGLAEHARLRARMLADLGFITLAADLHGEGYVASSHDETIQRVTFMRRNPDVLRSRIRGAFDALCRVTGVDQHRIAAVGYCFGGLAVLELARTGAPLAGTVSFHGLLETRDPADAANIVGKVLVCTGADDHLVPPLQIAAFEKEMSAARVDWQLIKYGGAKHAFTNSLDADQLVQHGFSYSASADRRSWDAMCRFLEEVFEMPRPQEAYRSPGSGTR
jgi:dienelactone hydrolase